LVGPHGFVQAGLRLWSSLPMPPKYLELQTCTTMPSSNSESLIEQEKVSVGSCYGL
jgi:hypothetical protein